MKKNLDLTRDTKISWLKKLFRIMKLTTFLILFSVVCVFANETYSQSKKINLNMKNVLVKEVLSAIEDQSEFKFMYSGKVIDVYREVAIKEENSQIEDALKSLFAGTDVNYTIKDRIIVLSSTEILNNELLASQQQKSVSGKVTDSSGASLPGVSVVVKGTTTGVVTDNSGNYSLSNIPENAILQFSFVGMKTQEIVVGNKSVLNLVLQDESIGLDEVVAIGYGTQKKVNLTGSIDVVSGNVLENRSAQNVGMLLQGVTPNLNINVTNQGGKPGSTTLWNIRGMGSINGGDQPLVLIDGVESQTDVNNLDPESIESISVLKDASASAIYGSRAPFGVVLIITKHGKNNEPIRINYNNNLSFSSPIAVPYFADSYTWVTAFNEGAANSGFAPIYPDEQVKRVKGYIDGTYKTEYDPNNPPTSIWTGRWMGNANNDWPTLYWKKNAFSQKHNVSMEGGDSKTRYFISSSYFDQGGLNNWGHDGYKRYNILANVSSQVTNWIRFDFSTKYAKTNQDQVLGIVGQTDSYIYRSILTFSPMMPYHNINGSIYNPLIRALQSGGRAIDDNNDLMLTLGAEIEPVKGWKTNISFNYDNAGFIHTENPKPVPVELPTGQFGNIGYATSGSVENMSNSNYSLFNVTTSYEKSIGNHNIKALVGYEEELSNYRGLNGSKMDLITSNVPSINTALGAATLSDAISHWATQGVFGRINYNFKEKYLLEFSARDNGSSRFAPRSRFGFFPSVSAGYNIAREGFWETITPYINQIKIRGSYGSLGNQYVANYLYLSRIPVNIQLPYIIGGERPIYAQAPNLISSNLTWETVTTADVGIDAGFLKNRLNLTLDWFSRATNNMIGPSESLPAVLGTTSPPSNNAKLATSGFEISIGWTDRISTDLSYNVKIAIGNNTTKILKFKNDSKSIDSWNEGRKIGEIWGLTTDKLIQTVGEKMPDQSFYYNTWGPGDMTVSYTH